MRRPGRVAVSAPRVWGAAAALWGILLAGAAQAEPYLAVANGLKCSQCHVNPTGGGERTVFGEAFSQGVLPANHLDTGGDTWTGQLNRYIAIGGDLRYDGTWTQVSDRPSTSDFELQRTRIYLSASPIPNRLLLYVDEQVAGPDGVLNREAWGMFWSADHSWYVKAGQMYLPFGLRLQDQGAFVLRATGIDMTTSDAGVEFGWLKGHWDAQLNLSNGTADGPATGNGKQTGLQLSYVESRWRLGVAANINNSSSSGSRSAYALFGGLKTGPVAWLAQAEITDDESLAVPQKQLGGLLEANYSPARGHNIKVTAEYLNENRDVSDDRLKRLSLVYEYTPIQFVQLRGGVRYNDGILGNPQAHQSQYFIELHGFF